MFMLKSRLLIVILVIGALTIVLSCSQTDDVVSPKSMTKIWLDVDRLPAPPGGMIYGLWASKVPYPLISQVSQVSELGRFSHMVSDTLVAFLDEDGVVRTDSNEFALEGDLFGYSYFFVSIENDTASSGLPGPMMLGQNITGSTDTIRMYFPRQDSLWESIVRCNFQTPTTNNIGTYGAGLWFCNHGITTRTIHDTLGVAVSYTWDTIHPIIGEGGDTLNLTDLRKEYPDSVWYTFDTTLVDFGRDTLALGIGGYIHYGATRHIIRTGGTDVPRIIKSFSIDVDSSVSSLTLDVFSQDLFNLPDLSQYGWKYKGWIVSDNISPAALGKFTPPAWDFTTGEVLIPGYQGGLLTTGSFVDETDNDLSNPFTLNVNWEVDSLRIDTISTSPLVTDSSYERYTVRKWPRFPGEDFLNTAALSDSTHGVITAQPYVLARPGSIFISIEPDNMVTDTTNFPLIAFSRTLPSTVSNVWTLMNWAGVADGSKGFPKIEARIKRF